MADETTNPPGVPHARPPRPSDRSGGVTLNRLEVGDPVTADGRAAPVLSPGCPLCATPGDFGPHHPTEPRSGLCPACVAAGKPTRGGLEQAVLIVAGQTLTGAETLDLAGATPEELTYHLGMVKRSLRSLLQLLAPVAGEEDR